MSEPVADDVRAAGTGWFVALMLLLVIALIAVSVATAIKCRIGAIYPGQCRVYKRDAMFDTDVRRPRACERRGSGHFASPSLRPIVKPRLHDTTDCQTG